jgi:2,3-bisphosphoglycerate-independent phosphoglycerate mutase
LRPGGSLRDIAPTLLGVLGVPAPVEMTGRDLRVLAR